MKQQITESTRYLCAAVQLDNQLCDQIIEEFIEDEYKVIGICYGVDVPTVLKSCLMAKKRRVKRDFWLAILFFILFLSLCLTALIPIFVPLSFVLYATAWRIVFLEQRKSLYQVIGRHFLKGNFEPEFFDLQIDLKMEQKLKEVADTQDANVIIYGEFSPFVGSGLNINGWSFVVDLNKGKEHAGVIAEPLLFQINELYDYISNSINNLKLNNLCIEDNLYVSGQEIRYQGKFLPRLLMRPITRVELSFIKDFIENSTHSIRHYRCIRISDWKGELILSIFLRFSKIGQSLFIEANYYLLTPLRQYYRQFDSIKPDPSSEDIRTLACTTAFMTVVFGIHSLRAVFQRFNNSRKKNLQQKKQKKEIRSNPTFNYGAVSSLRERISQNQYRRYFQKLDQEMYLKVIERKIVDSLSKFLDSKNIDTSDFKDTKAAILNHGVIVSGGSIQAQSFAVGERAKSILGNWGSAGATAQTNETGSFH